MSVQREINGSRCIKVFLSAEMFAELQAAVDSCNKGNGGFSPISLEAFVSECVESVLASRRLARMPDSEVAGHARRGRKNLYKANADLAQ